MELSYLFFSFLVYGINVILLYRLYLSESMEIHMYVKAPFEFFFHILPFSLPF